VTRPLVDLGHAKRYAKWMHNNQSTEIVVCQPYPTGGIYVKARNKAGMTRVVASIEDFDNLKKEMGL